MSENFIWKTNQGGEILCETASLTMTKTEGKTGHYASSAFTAQGRQGNHSDPECEVRPSGLPFLVTSLSATVNLNGEGTGTATFSFTTDFTHPTLGSLMCTSESSSAVTVTYTTTRDVVRIIGALTGGPAPFCVAAGTMTADFAVSDEFGERTSIH